MEIKTSLERPVFNLDAAPRIPEHGWRIATHKKGGQFAWDPDKVALLPFERSMEGEAILKLIRRKNLTVFNATLLDNLLDNQELIPDTLKTDENGNPIRTVFWDTLYENPIDEGVYVRVLFFSSGRWLDDRYCIEYSFGKEFRSLIAA